jgi:hypothetical protein
MMADFYDTILKVRAKKLITNAQQQGLDFTSFMKAAAKTGVASDPNVQSYAQLLREDQLRQRQSGMQAGITGAVGKALQTRQPVVGSEQLMQRADQATTMSPQEYAQTLQGQPSVTDTATPQTREQLYGALGRQELPPDATFEDVKDNPQFQFAKEQFPGAEDELARARLKVQQDAEARKTKQIGKQREQADLRLRLQDRELAWKYYNAGVNAQKPEFLRADKWDQMAEGASKDLAKMEGRLDELNTIKKELNKPDSEYFGAYDPTEIDAQIAEAETLARNAKIQKDQWAKKATEIMSGAYERGGNISKGSKKTFEKPAGGAPAMSEMPPAPTGAPGTAGTIQNYRDKFNY